MSIHHRNTSFDPNDTWKRCRKIAFDLNSRKNLDSKKIDRLMRYGSIEEDQFKDIKAKEYDEETKLTC